MKTITGKIIALALVIGGLIYSQSVWAACNAPAGMNSSGVTSTSAVLNWNVVSNAIGYNVQYKLASSSTWSSSILVTTPTYTLSGLTASTAYNWRVQSKCSSTQTSNWTSSQSFTTLAPPCNVPTGLNTVNISTTSATLKWLAVSGAQSYNVQYRATGAQSWTSASTSVNSYPLSSLNASAGYEWKVQTNCGSSNTSSYSSVITFTTSTPCAVPANLTSTGITTTDATLNWDAVSGAQNYNVQYRQVGASSWTTQVTVSNSASLSSLNPSANYEWQVQADCGNFNSSAYSSTAMFTTVTPSVSCNVPSGLNVTAITSSGATLNWSAVSGAQGYKIQYRVVGAPSWTSANLPAASTFAVSFLAASTNYEWQLQTNCGNSNFSAFSSLSTFTTLAFVPTTPTPVCNVPAMLSASNITGSTVTLQWMGTEMARNYQVQYREVGASSWNTTSSMITTMVNITALEPATNYEWQVMSTCGSTLNSGFSAMSYFSTAIAQVCNEIPTTLTVTAMTPNSATLSWAGGTSVASVSGFDVRYREMLTSTWNYVRTSAPTVTLSSLLSTGAYEWQVRTDCGGAGISTYSTVAMFTMQGHVPSNTSQYFDPNNIPNPNNPATWNVIFQSSGDHDTDAQIVHDWLVAHGCILP